MNNNSKKPSQVRAYLALSWYSFRAMTRNKATFAFGFLFPVVFICIFGLIGGSGTKINIGVVQNTDQNPALQTIESQGFVKITKDSKSNLEDKLRQGKIASIVYGEDTGGKTIIHVVNSTANPTDDAAVNSLVSGIVDKTNLAIARVKNPPLVMQKETISGRQFRYIDFALPGQIGFSLLSTAIFGTVFGFIYLKKSLVLKRMFSTPTKPLTMLLAQGTSRLIMALLQTLLILGIGVVVFHFYLPHGFLTFIYLIILSSFGLIAFLGFGFFLAGLANDENSAGPLVNLITLPQFLLSGTFFSTDNFPNWLQPIANNLPLSYLNIAIRKVTTEGGSLHDTVPYLAGLACWSIIMYLLAAKTFKWQ